MASSVTDRGERQAYLEQLAVLESEARTAIADAEALTPEQTRATEIGYFDFKSCCS